MLVDSHAHLDAPSLSRQLPDILARARQADVGVILCIGISKPDFPKVIAMAESAPELYCCLGIQPHDAMQKGQEITTEELIALAAHPKVIGFGETGLEYFHKNVAPRDAQEQSFRAHIRACIATNLPLVIHSRQAEDDTMRILKEERAGHEDRLRGVFHCFSSQASLAKFGLEIGFYFSAAGVITFEKSQELRDIFAGIPLDRLLVETDSPYLAPVPLRGKLCEPSFVTHTAACLAKIKNISEDEIARATTDNFFNLFTKAERP
ncbi:MAG: TatD family hydrolase [Alphaproteobacteria bacterium]|nr:TatD family hydrolase [Alphaproteobacteria bacterium]